MANPSDRNLLLGLLALQMDFIDRDELIESLQAWVSDQSASFAALLVRRGCFDDDVRSLLESLLERRIGSQSGAGNGSLASVAASAAGVVCAKQDLLSNVDASLMSSNAAIDETIPHAPAIEPDTPVPDLSTKPAMPRDETSSHGTLKHAPSVVDAISIAESAIVRQRVGDKIVFLFGDYQLHEVLGRGGMGVVYRATQRSLKRVVALKMIKSGELSSSMEVDRFRAEAEAAAKLDHPNIVPVYEIGELNGQHYFSMGYVDGQNLGALVKDGPLAPTEAARLVEHAARAVQHAHDRGVVHRDLKPANILLQRDEAKRSNAISEAATAGSSPSKPAPDGAHPSWTLKVADFGLAKQINAGSGMTHTGDILGTPGYMSPEQALGKKAVGPLSDVYSLGAVLYHLVTGRPPFQAASPMETLRQVIEVEPVSVRALNPAVTKDLETICHKCLQKDPSRRYPSAAALADDLAHLLRGEPIAARPVSTFERTMRWAKRRPAIASLSAAVVVAVAAGIAGTSIYAMHAKDMAEKASDEAQRATIQANIARDNEQLAKDEARKAETEFRRAKKAIDDYFTAVSESKELKQQFPGLHEFRISLLNKAVQYYNDFLKERGNDPGLQVDAAKAYFNRASAANEIGRNSDALASYCASIAILERLTRDNPSVTDYSRALAYAHNNLGNLQSNLGEVQAAVVSYHKSLAIQEKLVRDNPNISALSSALAGAYNSLAILESKSADKKSALRNFAKALAIQEKIVRNNPTETEFASRLASMHNNLGVFHDQAGRAQAAFECFGKALAIQEKLVRDHPQAFEHKDGTVVMYINLGTLQGKLGNTKAALANYDKARGIREELVHLNPKVTEYARQLAVIYTRLAMMQSKTGDRATALASCRQALSVLEKLALENPKVTEFAVRLGGIHTNIGNLTRDTSLAGESLAHYGKAIAVLSALAKTEEPGREMLLKSHLARGKALVDLDRFDEAIADFDAALKLDKGSQAAAIRKDRDAALAMKKAATSRPK